MSDVLFLSHRIPYPPDKGDKIRAWHMLEHLARTRRVHLGCFIDDPADQAHLPTLRSICASVMCVPIKPKWQKGKALLRLRPGQPLTLGYYRHARLRRWVNQTLHSHRIDLVFAYCSAMAPYAMDPSHPALRMLDMVDVDSEKWTEYAARASWPSSMVWAREGRTLLRFEAEAAQSYDRTLFVSNAECARFGVLAPAAMPRLDWVENGVDLDRFSPDTPYETPFAGPGPHLVFTGTMDYWPNADAVCWFAREALPLIQRRRPGARFHVVGANPTPEVAQLIEAGVNVTGRVADVRPFIRHADVIVAPLRIARGIQNKVLEAMAMGRPVVASPQAFEGVRAMPGQDLLVADGPAALAEAVESVVSGMHPRLGEAARDAMEQSYAWDATLSRLDAILAAAGPHAVVS